MSEDKKDFKEVKVKVSAGTKDHVDTLDRTMLYSGVNIFGSLTQMYLANKEQLQSQSSISQSNQPAVQGGLAGASSNSMMQIGNEVLSIFKKLQKRDSITKIKAFQELNVFVSSIDSDSEELPNILTFFLFHMCRVLLNEQDKLVREAAHESFAGFIKKARRKLGPHIKKIFPIWYCTFFDSSPEVARLAKQNFEMAFPPEKQHEVFKLTFKMFLHFADEQIQQIEEAGEDKKLSEENFDRITSCVFQALANSFQFIQNWSAEDKQIYERKMLSILQLDQPDEKNQQKGQKGKKSVWNFLSSSYRGSVRAACLQFVAAFITSLPAQVVKKHVPALAPLVFSLIGEPNAILQTTLWREAIYTLTKNFPESWASISIKKDFLPKLYKCLKDSAYGASFSLYENFIKYVSVCPLYKLTDFQEFEDKQNKASFKDRCGLIREVMLNLYSGLQNDEAVVFHQELVNCYCDTLTFILQKRLQQVPQGPDLDFAFKQLEKVIQTPIFDHIDHYQKMSSKFQNARNLRSTVCQRYTKILVDLSERAFDLNLFGKVCEIILNALNVSKRNSMRFISQISSQLVNMKNEYQNLVKRQIIAPVFNLQTQTVGKLVSELSKQNITDCLETATAHRRLVYTLLKRNTDLSGVDINMLSVGDVLQQVIKKEKMAKSVLTADLQDKFKQLELTITEIGVLYMSSTTFIEQSSAEQEFSKVLEAVGLLEEQAGSKIDPLEDLIFNPGNPKVNQSRYFQILRSSEQLHELIVGAISIKMLNDQGVLVYQSILQKVIADSVSVSDRSILQDEDIDLIRTQLVDNISGNIDINVAASYFQCSKALCCQTNQENDELRLLLVDYIIQANQKAQNKLDEEKFQVIWNCFSEAVQNNQEYQVQVLARLTETTQKLIFSSKQSDVSAFNHLTRVIGEFVQLVEKKVSFLGKILLSQDNFSKLSQSCLPLKMFKDLFLQGGIGFDIEQLLATMNDNDDGYMYVWFAATLLSIKNLTSLSSLMDLKRQLMIFVETEVIPAFVSLAGHQKHRNFIISVFKFLAQNQQNHSLQFLANTMVDPGDQYASDQKPVLRVDDFKLIYTETIENIAQKALNSNFQEEINIQQLEQLVIILESIGYYILDEASVSQLFKCVSSNIKDLKIEDIKSCRSQLKIYMSLEKWLAKEDQTNFQVTLLNNLLTNQNLEIKQVAVDLCGSLLDKHPGQKLKSLIKNELLHTTILDLLENADLACQTTIQLCKVIRKTLDWSSQTATLISLLIQTAVDRAYYFDQSLQNLSKGMSAAVFIRPFEVEMLQELAETLLVFPLTLSELNLQPSVENSLYYLLGCGFEALQKSGFVLLKFIYENFIPSVQFKMDQDDDLKMLMLKHQTEESKEQEQVHSSAFKNISENLLKLIEDAPPQTDTLEENQIISIKDQLEQLVYGDSEEGQMNSKVFGYLLAWNAMLSKIENGRIKAQFLAEQGNTKASDYMQVLASLTEYLETDASAYQMLLVSLVPYLPKVKKVQQDMFKTEIKEFVPEYCNSKDPKQTQIFCLFTLINFMKSFPSLGRKFYQDCDRQLLEVMLPYIKSVVSPAILENEIKKIELSQLELGSSSDLTFVLFKSTKEVVATYNKTADISCKLLLKIPADYPLKSVQVDIGEQLKLKQTQLRRWTLSIRNLLQARNGDIISAILLWKTNIDKEMEGVEECFICYSVLHQSDKSLPSMQCKNCKNKFHVSCIRKWFNTSNKSNCPLCQTFFFQ